MVRGRRGGRVEEGAGGVGEGEEVNAGVRSEGGNVDDDDDDDGYRNS